MLMVVRIFPLKYNSLLFKNFAKLQRKLFRGVNVSSIFKVNFKLLKVLTIVLVRE